MKERVAIVGVGQTNYRKRHSDRNTAELVYEAVTKALVDAEMNLDAIDMVVGGVAPDALAGIDHIDLQSVARPGIPYLRVNTGGATGASAFLAALSFLAAGRARTVLVVAVERMGHAITAPKVFNSIFDPIYEKDVSLSTISMLALRATMLMQQAPYTLEHWAGLSAKNSASSMLNDTIENPSEFSVDEIMKSEFIAWPIRRREICPTTEGACATVITTEDLVGSRKAAWVHGAGALTDTYAMGDRMRRPEGTMVELLTLRRAAQKAFAEAGIAKPLHEVDLVEMQAPVASSEVMIYTALGLCTSQDGPRFVESVIDGSAPININLSGGSQVANPISATALIRIAECALQIRGKAGRRQRDGIRCAVATGQGGAQQFSTAVVLRAERP